MATIKDVAREAGVSPSTVSRTLHDSSLISQETKEKIWRAMKKLNYSPNFAAQNLANNTSNIIGVILPPNEESVANNPFFGQILQGITSVCNQQAYMVSVATGKDNAELIENVQMMMERGRVKRFIVTFSQQSDDVLEYLDQNNAEYVLIGEPIKNIAETLYVNNDNVAAGKDATEYLLDNGYHHPVYVYEELGEMVQKDRFIGYSHAMEADERTPLSYQIKKEHTKEELQEFIDQHPEVDSMVACDDIMGVTLQNGLLAIHQNLADYGIISFNNSLFARASHPSLTSVEIFPTSLGMEAAVLVLNVDDRDFTKLRSTLSHVVIPHKIVERESTKRK